MAGSIQAASPDFGELLELVVDRLLRGQFDEPTYVLAFELGRALAHKAADDALKAVTR